MTLVTDTSGKPFTWLSLSRFQELLHELDKSYAGRLRIREPEEESSRREYISRGIMEEAIASSQLEGASTTRAYAQQMLREQRKPRNKSDQMILNNFNVMTEIETRLREIPLTLDEMFSIHRSLTTNTLDSRNDEGRLRRDDDNVMVVEDDLILHIPPKREVLDIELEKLIAYANDELSDRTFTHPAIKAIILHFWIGYLHPFVDGNGRLARSLFYWYLLRKDYWAISYAPISLCIVKAPKQYRDAYLYSEQDDNDLTYFIDYNLRKIGQALSTFEIYLRKLAEEQRNLTQTVSSEVTLNNRQMQLLCDLRESPGHSVTAVSYQKMFRITYPTSLKDLSEMENHGYLERSVQGHSKPYRATEKARQLFRR
jgi:Fic family protein